MLKFNKILLIFLVHFTIFSTKKSDGNAKKKDLTALPYVHILRLLNQYTRQKLVPIVNQAGECPEKFKKAVVLVKELSNDFKDTFDPDSG